MEGVQQPMEVDHPNEVAIMNASKIRLPDLDQQYNCCGTSVDLYQFSYDPTSYWNQGHTFHANTIQDLSFEGRVEASDASNKREAVFLVHEANEQNAVENMMVRSLRLKHHGILRPYVAGYNTQISKVVSAFRVPTLMFDDWLKAEKEKATSTSIPAEVQELIRTAYQAIATIWKGGFTSDSLADACSYHMIDNKIKLDPLRIRDRNVGEDDEMPLRNAFGVMILQHIYPVWKDDELDDFVDLLNNPRAKVLDILGAPVLLLPARRELMYHNFDKAALHKTQLDWLQANANPEASWKVNASNADPTLKVIIDLQKRRDKGGVGFSLNFKGALHFASVVTAQYEQHFRKTAQGQWGVNMKDRVDLLLKQVLPRLLTRRYNSRYA